MLMLVLFSPWVLNVLVMMVFFVSEVLVAVLMVLGAVLGLMLEGAGLVEAPG